MPTLQAPIATVSLASMQERLERAFKKIEAERMTGMGLLNERLQVEALGFELEEVEDLNATTATLWAQGILITPWFMSLLRIPLALRQQDRVMLAVGGKAERVVWGQSLSFIANYDDSLGYYEASSLFSPMFEFESQAQAVATAQAIIDQLKAAQIAAAKQLEQASANAPDIASRRSFLFGRSNVATGGAV